MDGVLLVDRKEAARRLGISVRKAWQLTNTGELPVVRIGRAVRYRPADLEAFAADRVALERAGVPIRGNRGG